MESSKIKFYFSGHPNLHERCLSFTDVAKRIASGELQIQAQGDMFSPDNTNELLYELDRIVKQYEYESQERARSLLSIQAGLWIALILVMSAGAFFVFFPLLSRNKELKEHSEDLRNKLKTMQDKISEVTAMKTGFVAQMGHELRTPMSGVFGMIELAQRATDPNQSGMYLEQAKVSGKRLNALITDMVELSRLEAGDVALSEEGTHLRALIEDSMAECKSMADERGLTFISRIPEGLSVELEALIDSKKLTRVIKQLSMASFGMTDIGGLEAFVNWDFIAKKLMFEIRDTGTGIPKERLSLMLDSDTDLIARSTIETAEVGVVIARELLKLMGATLEIESELDKGTVFRFELDLSERVVAGTSDSEAPVGEDDDPREISRGMVAGEEDMPFEDSNRRSYGGGELH